MYRFCKVWTRGSQTRFYGALILLRGDSGARELKIKSQFKSIFIETVNFDKIVLFFIKNGYKNCFQNVEFE